MKANQILFIVVLVFGLAVASQAATIVWGPATNCVADTDVSTTGTLVYAMHIIPGSANDATINGVTFVDRGTNVTVSPSIGTQNIGAPSGFSTQYSKILATNTWQSATYTLNNLTVGQQYKLQVWACDKRYSASNYTTVTAGNTVNLYMQQGQYAIGTFTADATTQSFTTGNQFIFNALQLRRTTGTQHYIKGTVTPGSATVYYSTTSGGPYSTILTASDGTYSIPVPDNSGPYYIKAGKAGYTDSAEVSRSMGTSDVTGVDFTLVIIPTEVITWGAATQVAGDTDVSTLGMPVYAVHLYNGSGQNVTVNGVTFTDRGTNITVPSGWQYQNSLGAPSGFSTAYQSILSCDTWYDGTVTLNGLIDGRTYQLQVWSNDARGDASNQIETITMGNSVNLNKNINGSGYGQYAVGTFQAVGTSADLVTSGGAFNALQIRLLPVGTQHYIRGMVSPSSATIYYSTTSGGPYFTTISAGNGTYSIPVDDNKTYYVKAMKSPDYLPSAEVAVPVGTADVTGVNFTLAVNPAYTITASVTGTGGTCTPAGVTTLYQGQSQSYDIIPDSGNAISDLKIDGVSIAPKFKYSFTNVTANHTINATFSKPVGMNCKAVIRDAIAPSRLMKVWGKVKSTVNIPVSFAINDGYGDITIVVNGAYLPANFNTSKTAIVTGKLGSDRKIYAQLISAVPEESVIVPGVVNLKTSEPTYLYSTNSSSKSGGVSDNGVNATVWPGGGNMTWNVNVSAYGDYEVSLNHAAVATNPLAHVRVSSGSSYVEYSPQTTSGVFGSGFEAYEIIKMPGTIRLAPGEQTITMSIPDAIGSQVLNLRCIELVPEAAKATIQADTDLAKASRADTQWMVNAGFGVMFHWTSLNVMPNGSRIPFAQAVANFNVETFANKVQESGAGYVIFTVGHAENYCPAPIANWAKYWPGMTTSRDLVNEIADALNARGIKLIIYMASHVLTNAPNVSPQQFTHMQTDILTEFGQRYGTKVAGYWFDAWYWLYESYPDFSFKQFFQLCKVGNPDRVMCLNTWIYPHNTEWQDYWAGETFGIVNQPVNGTNPHGPGMGLRYQSLIVMEPYWVQESANMPAPSYDATALGNYVAGCKANGGAVTINLGIYQDGSMDQRAVDVLKAVRTRIGY